MVAEVIAKEFGSGPTVPQARARDVGVKPTMGQRAIVVTDPELTRAEVSIARLEPPRGPPSPWPRSGVSWWRASARGRSSAAMSAEIAAGRAAFLDVGRLDQEWAGTLRMLTVEASGRPGTWRAMLKELGHRAAARPPARLQRARAAGRAHRAHRRRGGRVRRESTRDGARA